MFYSGPVVVWLIVFDPSVCLSVCPRACLWNRWTDLRKICYADPLWLWLGLSLAVLRYVMTSGFMDDVKFGRSGLYELSGT